MSAETAALATTPHPLGKPGGPGLFRDKSLSLPPYIQNLAHSFIEKRGMEKSKAIQMAIGVTKNWASGKGKVHPEVRAAATSAVAEWEAAKAKARATPNKGDVKLSQPMTFLRSVLDGSTAVELSQPMAFLRGILDNGSTAVELANAPSGGTSAPAKKAPAPAKQSSGQQQQTKHTLPPGAVGWKHGWVPVNAAGQPVGPSQKDMSAQQIKDSNGHDSATQKAIASAYKNKATADAAKAKTKAAAAAKTAASKAASAKTKAANKAAAAKTAAAKKAATAKAAATKAKQAQVSAATKQALADQKAKRPLTPSQQALVNAYNAQQAATLNTLRNNVHLSQPVGREYTMEFSTELPADSQVIDSSVLELAKNPAGQLAFRFKHGWILINPAIPSRGHHGGGLAKMHGHKSGTVSHGRFVNEGGKTKFVKTHSSPSMAAWTKGVSAKADGVSANKAAAEAEKAARLEKLKTKAQYMYISGISDNPKNHDVKILREAASMAGKADHPALKAKALSSVADATGAPGDHHAAAQAYHDAAKAQTTKAMATVLRMQADKHTKAATPAPAPKAPDTFTLELPPTKTLYQKDAEYHASGQAAKVTKAKQAKTKAFEASNQAHKLNTAAAHNTAAKQHDAAHKALAEAGLTAGAHSALEASRHHTAKAKALGGGNI